MNDSDLFLRLAVALAIGLLVGLERGWQTRDEEDHQRAAGFRTFALSGLLGGIAGVLSQSGGGLVIGLAFVGYAGAFTAFHWLEARAERNFSATSVIAGLVTFLLGALAVVGDLRLAVAAGVVTTVLLALREQLHRWIASLTWVEIRAVLILLAMTFLALPVLPQRTVDPWNTINPAEIWLLAITIAAVSFGGYVAVRALGDRLGVVMAALAGGLASSTATTLTFAHLARDQPASARLLAAGVLIAGLVMYARVAIIAVTLSPALVGHVLLPLGAAAVALGLVTVVLLWRGEDGARPALQIQNPLQLRTALRLAGLIAIVLLASALLQRTVGTAGVLALAAISGVADVDAITISMARLGGADLSLRTAAVAILIAVAVNTVSKAVMAAWIGGRTLAWPVGLASASAVIASAVAALV